MRLLYGRDEEICRWVSDRIDGLYFDKSVAIGVIDPLSGHTIAGIVYNNYINNLSIEMSIASTSSKWCQRSILYALFAYPFIQIGVKRVQASCSVHNISTHKFLEKLGFQKEGIAREAWCSGGDAVVYSLLKHECKWLNYGKILK